MEIPSRICTTVTSHAEVQASDTRPGGPSTHRMHEVHTFKYFPVNSGPEASLPITSHEFTGGGGKLGGKLGDAVGGMHTSMLYVENCPSGGAAVPKKVPERLAEIVIVPTAE